MGEIKAKELQAILERAAAWPESAQDELIGIAQEIERELKGDYHATPEELGGIDRGLRAAAEGRFATDQQLKEALEKFRRV